ncbi:MAG: tRNA 2-thiouridine(34) synthase MnmA [Candidatus Cloacimonetes bacterium]|nr:tRNA 2-thiouridine(34) synthase MnmA [Candidatus Cloacimonadota bacterium]MCF7813206.1 tRNA 2-thiouridine(34) synthase MnmA [Candidatus Cloacimonadota bacterium]MCF7867405.1 tRNA 2-thiouridine(34) synthase MnmA [Candidatus Cloacimonadota bacterium]MCF7882963.1 tRNA 2-thiouridine(34) synthase MnmA [Candidatus Cloacimonadota bacterium]
MKIAVAMSGGVDSSVAAALLQKQGHEVFGVTMHHFDNSAYGFDVDEGIDQAILDAAKVCEKLQIPHHVLDIQTEFHNIVENHFINEYKAGRTPNPCTLCNPTIKWGVFHDQVLALGAEKVATGHYVKLIDEKGTFQIHKAEDSHKDQSYYLWALNQKQLSKTLFPISELTKPEVRKIAKEMLLPVHEKTDSQEICFIKGHYEDYLKKHLEFKSGNIVLQNGEIIGKHRGLPLYTIGQRKGLNTPWKSALFVLKLDVEKNELVVTDDPDDLLVSEFRINKVNWIDKIPEEKDGISVQIRYNSKPVPIKKLECCETSLKVILENPVRAVTPGQSAVFYETDHLLGGGVIL